MSVITQAQAQARADAISAETAPRSITPTEVGGLIRDVVDSVPFGASGGDVTGTGASVSGDIPLYSDTTGKVLVTSGVSMASIAASLAGIPAAGGAPAAINLAGVAASAGTDPDFARQDHVHSITGTLPTANIADAAITGVKLRAGNASGQEILWDGSQYLLIGSLSAILADANATLLFSTATSYLWPASLDTASTRTLTLGTTGLATDIAAGLGAVINIRFLRASYTNPILIKNNAGVTLVTIPAAYGKPVNLSFYYDTAALDYALAGQGRGGTIVAM